MGVNARKEILSGETLDRLARVLQVLFRPSLMIPAVILGGAALMWLYLIHGATGSFATVFYRPELLLPVLAIIAVSGVIHELGHASGLRYGGGRARGMGVGFYAIFPAFYTDVTDAYRLGRSARLRTDLGGLYFHLLAVLVVIGMHMVTGQEFLVVAAVLLNLDMVRQLLPFLRLDGYWIVADLTGIPDFFSQVAPFLRSVFRRKGRGGTMIPRLRTGAKVAFAFYSVVTVLILPALLMVMVIRLSALLPLAWESLTIRLDEFGHAVRNGALLDLSASLVRMLLLVLQMAGIAYFSYVLLVRPARAVWSWATKSNRRAPLASAAAGLLLLGAVFLPWSIVELEGVFLFDQRGSSGGRGAMVFVLGTLCLGASALMFRTRRRRVVNAAMLSVLLAGTMTLGLGVQHVMRAGAQGDELSAYLIESLEAEGTRQTTGAVPRQLHGTGLSFSPGLGVFVAMAGGLTAAMAGPIALRSDRRRWTGSQHSRRGAMPRASS